MKVAKFTCRLFGCATGCVLFLVCYFTSRIFQERDKNALVLNHIFGQFANVKPCRLHVMIRGNFPWVFSQKKESFKYQYLIYSVLVFVWKSGNSIRISSLRCNCRKIFFFCSISMLAVGYIKVDNSGIPKENI